MKSEHSTKTSSMFPTLLKTLHAIKAPFLSRLLHALHHSRTNVNLMSHSDQSVETLLSKMWNKINQRGNTQNETHDHESITPVHAGRVPNTSISCNCNQHYSASHLALILKTNESSEVLLIERIVLSGGD